jgi:peptidoglycan hydrolase-like protein with peptidoglycan-binding domain
MPRQKHTPAGLQGGIRFAMIIVIMALVSDLIISSAQTQPPQLQLEQIISAQRMLGALGYDAGAADGQLGPRTRMAIAAFQRAYNLPVTQELDALTLNALGLGPIEASQTQAPPPLTSVRPWRVVLTYLRYFDTQPARLLPYVTDHFRQGMAPHDWITLTAHTLEEQQFSRLSWQIERVEPSLTDAGSQADIHVHSRVRISGQEIARHEIFTVVRAEQAEWLIDNWRSEIIAPKP